MSKQEEAPAGDIAAEHDGQLDPSELEQVVAGAGEDHQTAAVPAGDMPTQQSSSPFPNGVTLTSIEG